MRCFQHLLRHRKTQVNETHGHEVSLTPSSPTPSGESSASRSLSTSDPSLRVSCRKILLLTCILCSADLLSTQLISLVSHCSTNCDFAVMVSPRNSFHQVLEFATTKCFQWVATTQNPCVHSRYPSERERPKFGCTSSITYSAWHRSSLCSV